MRTNYVLIDFESVQPESLSLIAEEHFKVLVFAGANQNKVPWDLMFAIHQMGKSRADYIKISGNGPNALDFHIAFYIGRLAAQDSNAFFHIVSKDTGFDPLIQHLRSQKISCTRCARIEDIPLIKTAQSKTANERAALYLAKLRQPKVTRPRALNTLRSSVHSFFQKQLTEGELAAVVDALIASEALAVSENKIAYSLEQAAA